MSFKKLQIDFQGRNTILCNTVMADAYHYVLAQTVHNVQFEF